MLRGQSDKSFRAEVMRLGGWGVIHGWEVNVASGKRADGGALR